jgi:hypothetical protein
MPKSRSSRCAPAFHVVGCEGTNSTREVNMDKIASGAIVMSIVYTVLILPLSFGLKLVLEARVKWPIIRDRSVRKVTRGISMGAFAGTIYFAAYACGEKNPNPASDWFICTACGIGALALATVGRD